MKLTKAQVIAIKDTFVDSLEDEDQAEDWGDETTLDELLNLVTEWAHQIHDSDARDTYTV